jgi:5'-3' exonuclease/DNA polymerase III epsilon subunit-like protein
MINMLRRLRHEWPADYAACVFDPKGPTFRDDIFPQYKANRSAMPDDLRAQLPVIFDAVRALGWPLLVVDGLEANDVIGTLAHQAQSHGYQTVIATTDRDLAQLVNERVLLIDTMSRDGGPTKVTDRQAVIDKFGVYPERIVDYLSLLGDAVDNVPGVDKVGPKTACMWLMAFNSLQGVIESAPQIGGSLGENLRKALDWLPTARTLFTVKRDADLSHVVPNFPESLVYGQVSQETLVQLRDQFDLARSLQGLLESESQRKVSKPVLTYFLDTETTGLSASDKIVELAIVDEQGEAAFYSLINPEMSIPSFVTAIHGINDRAVLGKPTLEELWDEIRSILRGNRVVIYNAAFDKRFFPDNLECAADVRCAMLEFSEIQKKLKGSARSKRHKLIEAVRICGYTPLPSAHSALVDAFECRRVWGFIHNLEYNDPEPRADVRLENDDSSSANSTAYVRLQKPELPSFATKKTASQLTKPELPLFAKPLPEQAFDSGYRETPASKHGHPNSSSSRKNTIRTYRPDSENRQESHRSSNSSKGLAIPLIVLLAVIVIVYFKPNLLFFLLFAIIVMFIFS